MKANLSILDFYSRRNLLRVIITLAVMAAAQVECYHIVLSGREQYQGFADLKTPFVIINFAAIAVISFFLCGSYSRSSRRDYRARLLKVSELRVFWLSLIFNIMVFLMVWAVQAAAILLCARLFEASSAYSYGPQGITVWLYSIRWFNLSIPMDNLCNWIAAIVFVLALSLACAGARAIHRRKRISISLLLTIALYLIFGLIDNDSAAANIWFSLILSGASLICAVSGAHSLDNGKRKETDDAQ